MKPTYYKALWHNCNRCRIHYMSDEPQLRAYLCDECWRSIPHYHVKNVQTVQKKVMKTNNNIEWGTIILYTIGNLLCLAVIGYYLWFK
jgi:hypothetical protein